MRTCDAFRDRARVPMQAIGVGCDVGCARAENFDKAVRVLQVP